MRDIFPSALDRRSQVIIDLFLFREIRDIEERIIIASNDGRLEVTIEDTGMTEHYTSTPHASMAEDYYNDWINNVQGIRTAQIRYVMEYFKIRGYKINVVSTNDTTFKWVVRW